LKVLILGASGSIGSVLFNKLSNLYDVYGTYNRNNPDVINYVNLRKYNIADYEVLDAMLDNIKPNLIISSLTGDFEQQLNAHKRINRFLYETSGRCIFISSANVFDGSPNGSKTEADTPYPISAYGKFKVSCERIIQNNLGNQCLIIRLPRTLSLKDIDSEIVQVEQNKSLFSNLYMSYNSADNVTEAIVYCIEKNKSGILHLTSDDYMLESDFMKTLLSFHRKNLSYTYESLTKITYCSLLGCDNPALLKYNNDGYFNLSLKSTDVDVSTRFGISCKKVISSLCTSA
jgi:dTDP-4-dehydrorhamnose reductase